LLPAFAFIREAQTSEKIEGTANGKQAAKMFEILQIAILLRGKASGNMRIFTIPFLGRRMHNEPDIISKRIFSSNVQNGPNSQPSVEKAGNKNSQRNTKSYESKIIEKKVSRRDEARKGGAQLFMISIKLLTLLKFLLSSRKVV